MLLAAVSAAFFMRYVLSQLNTDDVAKPINPKLIVYCLLNVEESVCLLAGRSKVNCDTHSSCGNVVRAYGGYLDSAKR